MGSGRHSLHICDFSDAEVEACWYAHADIRVFKKEIREIAKMVDQRIQVDCARGIEMYTAKGATQRRNDRLDAAMALFLEQERQDKIGCFDEEKLASSYREHTESCQSKALLIGIADRHAVKPKHHECFLHMLKNTEPRLNLKKKNACAA